MNFFTKTFKIKISLWWFLSILLSISNNFAQDSLKIAIVGVSILDDFAKAESDLKTALGGSIPNYLKKGVNSYKDSVSIDSINVIYNTYEYDDSRMSDEEWCKRLNEEGWIYAITCEIKIDFSRQLNVYIYLREISGDVASSNCFEIDNDELNPDIELTYERWSHLCISLDNGVMKKVYELLAKNLNSN